MTHRGLISPSGSVFFSACCYIRMIGHLGGGGGSNPAGGTVLSGQPVITDIPLKCNEDHLTFPLMGTFRKMLGCSKCFFLFFLELSNLYNLMFDTPTSILTSTRGQHKLLTGKNVAASFSIYYKLCPFSPQCLHLHLLLPILNTTHTHTHTLPRTRTHAHTQITSNVSSCKEKRSLCEGEQRA